MNSSTDILLNSYLIDETFNGDLAFVHNKSRFRKFRRIGNGCKKCFLAATHIIEWQAKDGATHFDYAARVRQEWVILTLDHIVPVSKGGVSHWMNMQCLCMPCNQLKADYDNETFMENENSFFES